MSEQVVEVRGEIRRFFFKSESFCAGKLEAETGSVSFAGQVFANEGDRVILHGRWETSPKFGQQLKVESFAFDEKLDSAGLADFLARSQSFQGIGPKRAAKIARAASAHPGGFEAAIAEPELFAAKAEIPLEVARALQAEWSSRGDLNRAQASLAAFGLSPGQSQKLVKRFGAGAIRIVEENPYWLIGRVAGMGFKTVDKFALSAGIPKAHPGRIEEAILFALGEQRQDGHTWTSEADLIAEAQILLVLDSLDDLPKVEQGFARLIAAQRITRSPILHDGSRACWQPFVFRAEASVADVLYRHGGQLSEAFGRPSPESMLALQPKLTQEQARAVAAALGSRISIITGGAGVGKTFVIQTIVEAARERGLHAELCAPTGKAAKRMSESCGHGAQTVHRLLEPTREDEIESSGPRFHAGDAVCLRADRSRQGFILQQEPDPSEILYSVRFTAGRTEILAQEELAAFSDGGMRFAFARNEGNPIDADIVIVDEFSMVDVLLAHDLFRAIDWSRTSVVLVGDHNQLPPVGPGAILRDAIASRPCPVSMLTQVHRNAGELREKISGVLAGKVPAGNKASKDDRDLKPWYVFDGYAEASAIPAFLERLFGVRLAELPIADRKAEGGTRPIDPVWDCQLLTPQHKGPIGRMELNLLLQRVAQRRLGREVPPPAKAGGRPPIMEGDKVIQLRNNYSLGIMNGSIGRVLKAEPKKLRIDFDGEAVEISGEDLRDIELAYAITIHKSQGSEFPIAITICHKSHGYMHHRGLIYTAVSRARQSSILIGDSLGMHKCARELKADKRRSMLSLLPASGLSLDELRAEALGDAEAPAEPLGSVSLEADSTFIA